jgi:ABC-type oligopeptide transport system substrate-binding subunit
MANRSYQLTSTDVRFLGQDPDVWMRNYTTTGVGNGNPANWSDAEVDALVLRQQTETDAPKQTATLLEVQRALFKKAAPIINLYCPYNYTGRWDYYHPVLDRGYAGTIGLHAWMEPKR